MILDINKLQIKYFVNDEDYGVAFDKIENTSYRVCICVRQDEDVLQFVKYENMRK